MLYLYPAYLPRLSKYPTKQI